MENYDFKESGISSVMPGMKGEQLDELMATPGKKIILNTWVYNLSEITPHLIQSLKDNNTTIDFFVLNPKSDFAKIRGEELNRDVKSIIEDNITELLLFAEKAGNNKVNIFLYDSSPKITLYATGHRAMVGFFWPGILAAHSPQFIIENNVGIFSSCVWNHFERVQRIAEKYDSAASKT